MFIEHLLVPGSVLGAENTAVTMGGGRWQKQSLLLVEFTR